MITEKAQVVAINEDAIWLKSTRQSACDSCKLKTGCGQKLLAEAKGRQHFIEVPVTKDFTESLSVHDDVDVAINEQTLLKGSLVLYVLPLILMLLGAVFLPSFLPSAELSSDIFAIFGAILGLLLGFGLSFILSQKMMRATSHQPFILPPENSDNCP
ncbi:MAG: SoxR reducing system RseC family protein [Cellvibrionales bacterium]|nr:SoxR reducing system RseC family protein [Cellvibrionales bacterium]